MGPRLYGRQLDHQGSGRTDPDPATAEAEDRCPITPAPRLAITEYSHGGADHISGAIAQADTLGIFGREEVFRRTDLETRPVRRCLPVCGGRHVPQFRTATAGAFGDTHIFADTTDIGTTSVYASYDSDNPQRMVIVAINKSDAPLPGGVRHLRAPCIRHRRRLPTDGRRPNADGRRHGASQ